MAHVEGIRMPQKSIKVFISYRQVDNPDFVERIRDWLVNRYGRDNVFMDFDSIPSFTHFENHILEKLDESDVVVPIIGPQWLELLQEKVQNKKPDYVVLEITHALKNSIVVAPICIKGANVPSKNELPSEIQELLDYNVAELKPKTHFLNNIEVIMDDIEKELRKQGHTFEKESKSKQIWNLSIEELDAHILDLLEQNQLLTIKRYMRNFSKYFWETVSNAEETPNDELKEFIDKIFVLGSIFIQYEQKDLYEEFVRLIQRLFDDVHKRTSGRYSSQKESNLWVWLEITCKLYVLGAILVQEKNYSWLAILIKHSINWESNTLQTLYWIRYTQIFLGRAKLIKKGDVLKVSIDFIKNEDYFFQLFSYDDEVVIASMCQFDFLQCIFVDINNSPLFESYPRFGLFYKYRTTPIIESIITDGDLRQQIFGVMLTDEELAKMITRLDNIAHRQFGFGSDGWYGQYPQVIKIFLDNNLPSDYLNNPQNLM